MDSTEPIARRFREATKMQEKDCYPCRVCNVFVDVSDRIKRAESDLGRTLLHSIFNLHGALCQACYDAQEKVRSKHD